MPYANPEDRRRYFQAYREKHRERLRELNRKYKKARREAQKRTHKVKIYKDWRRVDTINKRVIRQELKREVLTHYGGGQCVCVRCGVNDIRCLSIDHINSKGAEERKSIGGGSRFYAWLKKMNYPEGYQTLCMNCQFLKRAELKEYGQGRGVPENQGHLSL